jgi:hypothetical protein
VKGALLAGLLLLGGGGPYDILFLPTRSAPEARGTARLHYATSPFGVAVTPEGVARWTVRFTLEGLPPATTLGNAQGYVAWAASSDLREWDRLGTVTNGTATLGHVARNKFMVVVTAEPDTTTTTRRGPTVLSGISPSSWMQPLLTHALFRGIPPG